MDAADADDGLVLGDVVEDALELVGDGAAAQEIALEVLAVREVPDAGSCHVLLDLLLFEPLGRGEAGGEADLLGDEAEKEVGASARPRA